MEKISYNNEELILVNIDELEKLNNISLEHGYNRGLNSNIKENHPILNSQKFLLRKYMIHNFKQGETCEPHMRYSGYQEEDGKYKNMFMLDLPLESIEDLLI